MSTQPPSNSDTIQAGKIWLRNMIDKGAHCPLCGQHAKLYKRKINSGMARSLIHIYRIAGNGWIHVSAIGARSREEGKLAYWGLLEEQAAVGVHGGRAGYWRLTDRGISFVRGNLKVPKYAHVYDGRVQGFDATEMVDIKDALGTKFNYQDLMNGV